jgi:hypothetical protein
MELFDIWHDCKTQILRLRSGAPKVGHGGFKVQVQQCITLSGQEMGKEGHGKDGKQRTFSTFPRHGYGYLFESFHEFCCTWTLNVPTRFNRTPKPLLAVL